MNEKKGRISGFLCSFLSFFHSFIQLQLMIHTCKGKEREKKGNILQEFKFKLDVLVLQKKIKIYIFAKLEIKVALILLLL